MMRQVGQSEHAGKGRPWQYSTLIAAGGLRAVCMKSGTHSAATTKLPSACSRNQRAVVRMRGPKGVRRTRQALPLIVSGVGLGWVVGPPPGLPPHVAAHTV